MSDNDATYSFERGYPTSETIQQSYDDADLNRAIQAYRFFYATVSGMAMIKGNDAIGILPNKVFGTADTKPIFVGYTLNSDTPYGPITLDLRVGPIVVELPPGPLICAMLDLNQGWIADMGLPGPDAGQGGKHLIVPPDYDGALPDGYHVWHSKTNLVIGGARSLPIGGDVPAALARLREGAR